MIKVIAFDFGGVLYTWDKAKLLHDLSQELKVAPTSVEIAWNDYIFPFEIGKEKEKDFWKDFLNFLDLKYSTKKLHQIVFNQFKPMKRNIALLKKLKKHYPIALLSDHTDWIEELEKKLHFKKLFDFLIVSKDVGIKKPDKKIFNLLIKKAKVKPKEILFIDNRIEFTKPVKKSGIHFIFYNSYQNLIRDLKKLKIKLKLF